MKQNWSEDNEINKLIRVYIYIYVCMYVCMYVHTSIYTQLEETSIEYDSRHTKFTTMTYHSSYKNLKSFLSFSSNGTTLSSL